MIRVDDQDLVQYSPHSLRGHLPAQHVEEVGGGPEVDVYAAVEQPPPFAVNPGDGGAGSDDTLKPTLLGSHSTTSQSHRPLRPGDFHSRLVNANQEPCWGMGRRE